MIAAGLGLAVLPREAVIPYAGAGRLVMVPLDEEWSVRHFVIVARPAPLLSATGSLLARFLAGTHA